MQVKNLPAISARYWVAILAASMCGANTGDFLARKLHLGHANGLLPLAVLFGCILWAERRSVQPNEAFYWLAIIVVRTAATNLADLATHDVKLGYDLVEPGLTALLVAILLLDPARDRRTGRKAVSLPTTNGTYWLAMLTAGTLGTTSGDFVARIVGLGTGSLILAAVYCAVVLVAMRVGGMSVPWYWASIVAARTAGTTMGDLAARHQGLPLSTATTGLLLAGIVWLWRDRPAVQVRET